ncbi:Dynein light chain roadblock-type 2 [Psilocybe cubensis]|uniref:Dynein light chain roadblock-type 2 n=2 Tax=Psilocybe cubensis TaxID=181762 RepID=A0ACB8GJE1_PSICU|nr:Dynein light chain roadblock-type 2 [Psilocybe cubensis]KAH9475160.1 Dynein light chain roadblock-type 2 [Psilocybe cubensis]
MALRQSTQPSTSTARTSFISQPNHASANPAQAPNPNAAMSPELEQTLAMLSSHRSVLGYMLITRGHHPSIIRHSGVIFEGEQGKRYAAVVARIVESVQAGLEEVRVDDGLGAVAGEAEVDEVKFMRIRTKKHEIMISPDDKYLLAVLHDPTT